MNREIHLGQIKTEWLDEKNLKVIYDKSSETYEMDKKVNDIEIDYVGK
ncbi:hypothetical protein ACTHPV_25175 [Ferdinandcohnia sp. SAFN-114]